MSETSDKERTAPLPVDYSLPKNILQKKAIWRTDA